MLEKIHSSKVYWKKTLENYRNAYTYEEPWEIAILELIANSIDAKAKVITIKTEYNDINEKLNITCIDDGLGMSEEEFTEYHNLSSLSKSKGKTIGFAGIGAKLVLDLCDKVYTETKKMNNQKLMATEWWFSLKSIEPKYKYVEPEGFIRLHGTYIRIEGLKTNKYSIKDLIRIIYEHYQYVLEEVTIYVNEFELKSVLNKLRSVAKKYKKLDYRPRRRLIKRLVGEIFYLDERAVEVIKKEYEGICGTGDVFKNWFDIVVFGKTVRRYEHFNLYTVIQSKYYQGIVGYIRCDELIQIVKTSKDDINKKEGLWISFANVTKTLISKWLEEEKMSQEFEENHDDDEFDRELLNISKDLGKFLRLPKFQSLLEKLMPPGITSKKLPLSSSFSTKDKNETYSLIPIVDSVGDELGKEYWGGELGRGTHGGSGMSPEPTVPNPGDDFNIKAATTSTELDDKVVPISVKKVRSYKKHIKVSWSTLDDLKETVEWAPQINTFIINASHPAAMLAEVTNAKFFYTIHEILRFLTKIYAEENYEEQFWELYSEFINTLS